MKSQPLTLRKIRQQLEMHQPQLLPADRGHAAVSLLLHEHGPDPELLFIIRAPHDNDPWSGDIAFPGGRVEMSDSHPRHAAERETMEELGIDLQRAEYLGRLDDLYGATLPILVSCFAYYLPDRPGLQLNHEVAETFWFPLSELLSPQRHHQATFFYRNRRITHPAVDLIGLDRAVLWGITYRLIGNFFALFDLRFGSGNIDVDARP